MPAHAATSSEIKQQIDAAIEKQNMAHQIAEYVRSFGEDDSHPAIQFAQEKWAEQQSILIPLYEQYNKAVQEENSIWSILQVSALARILLLCCSV